MLSVVTVSEILCTEVVTSLVLAARVVAPIYFCPDVSGFVVFVPARAYRQKSFAALSENKEPLVIIGENLT